MVPDSMLFYIACAVAVLITGISKGGFGGAAMLAVPIMSVAIPPFVAAAITLPILIVMDGLSIAGHWQRWNMGELRLLLPAAAFGIGIGAVTAEFASPDMTRLLVGGLALAFVIWSNLPHAKASKATTPAPQQPAPQQPSLQQASPQQSSGLAGAVVAYVLGAAAGYTSYVAHAGGPPAHAYLLRRALNKQEFSATAVLFFAVVNLLKLPAYLGTGMITADTFVYSFMFMPLAPIGVWLGLRLNTWLNPAIFFRIIHGLLLVVGMKLCADGLTGLGLLS